MIFIPNQLIILFLLLNKLLISHHSNILLQILSNSPSTNSHIIITIPIFKFHYYIIIKVIPLVQITEFFLKILIFLYYIDKLLSCYHFIIFTLFFYKTAFFFLSLYYFHLLLLKIVLLAF
jgi:hypothetical protein